MDRQSLLETVDQYRTFWLERAGSRHAGFDRAEEEAILSRFTSFVESTPDCFERTSPLGHVTASALVVSPELDRVLLTLHGKLNLWLQLGGHADGDPRVHEVAHREVLEESGLKTVRFLPYENESQGAQEAQPLPFDFDCHDIPARKSEPRHVHYDVRYLIVADPREPLLITEESKDLRWFTLAEAREVTDERSMLRQFDKLDWLRSRLLTDRVTGLPYGKEPTLTQGR
jgi:8-oxo-dGTP pyrophosphatase MutT (NUDIX family)